MRMSLCAYLLALFICGQRHTPSDCLVLSVRRLQGELARQAELVQVGARDPPASEPLIQGPAVAVEGTDLHQIELRAAQAGRSPQGQPGSVVLWLVGQRVRCADSPKPQPAIEGVIVALPDEQAVCQGLALVAHQAGPMDAASKQIDKSTIVALYDHRLDGRSYLLDIGQVQHGTACRYRRMIEQILHIGLAGAPHPFLSTCWGGKSGGEREVDSILASDQQRLRQKQPGADTFDGDGVTGRGENALVDDARANAVGGAIAGAGQSNQATAGDTAVLGRHFQACVKQTQI